MTVNAASNDRANQQQQPPKGTETAAIEDSYAYHGDGLRTSETISGTTTYLAWDLAEGLPLILNDGVNSYIYGPGGLPVEQINNSTGTALYLHHDQQGSTRLLTSSTGKQKPPSPTTPTATKPATLGRVSRRWATTASTPTATPG
jgi:hypothetical protein